LRKLLLCGVAALVMATPVMAANGGRTVQHVDMTPAEMQELYKLWQGLAASDYSKRSAGLPIPGRMKARDETVRSMKSAAEFAYTGCLARGVAGEKRCKQIFDVSVNALMDWAR
jgi:hypothetical protein